MHENIINKMLIHCVETVPFYQKNVDLSENISLDNFPIVTKENVALDSLNFISNKYLKLYQQGKLINKKTSGSTGNCLDIYWSHNHDTLASLEAWKYRKSWYDISIKDRYVSFHTTIYYSNCLVEKDNMVLERGINLSLSKNLLNKENINLYLEKIKQFDPKWMFTQPSILQILLTLSPPEGINILNKIKYIELTGEYLTNSNLQYFKDRLPDVVIANMYGTTETGCVALQCPHGNMHILENAHVTIVDDQYKSIISSEGNILLSSLKNYAMPLINYRIGDKGIKNPSKCLCGFEGYDLKISFGREGDIINLPNGDLKSCYTLLKSIESVNDEFNNPITYFHFVQEDLYTISIYLTMKPQFNNWKTSIEELLIRILRNDLPGISKFEVLYGPNPLLKEQNKLKFFYKNF